jgi:isoquinoline 1-oxidoreductase beta subunit
VDAEAIVTGALKYGLDSRETGGLVAVIARCPFLGGDVARFDPARALAIPGVRHVVPMPPPDPALGGDGYLAAGVAVVAQDTWSALRGRAALDVEWTPAAGTKEASTDALRARCIAALAEPGVVVRELGDPERARAGAARTVEARYELPFLAHATLEPQNALVEPLSFGRSRVCAPTQNPLAVLTAARAMRGGLRSSIAVELPRAGGGFGRRLHADAVFEAAFLADRLGEPVQVVWDREDDLRNDFYRPFSVHALSAAVDENGGIAAWFHKAAATPLAWRPGSGEDPAAFVLDPDAPPVGSVPHARFEVVPVAFPLPRGMWRAPMLNAAAFAAESFADELAHALGVDPVELRLRSYGAPRELPYSGHGGPVLDTGRLAQVLRSAAERIGWGVPLEPGRGRGVAARFVFGAYVAHAIEVDVRAGRLHVARCVCAADVGQPVNPLGLEAQLMGATLDGLSAALHQEVTVREGRVVEGNFDAYRLLSMAEAPRKVEVAVMPRGDTPSGAGEVALPTAAPALANAIFAATGRRIRRLPIREQWRADG